MRCSQAEHLLSLNLDGRLASSQRRTLSDHLGECARCREIDHELSAARQLALSLPVQRVSQGFREELWQRIRAGEGSPEAMFREPTPWATKVRYFAIGAAAAGLFIFAAHWLRSYLGPHAEPAMGPHAVEVAKSDPAPGKLVRRDSSPGIAPVVPATPDRLATLVTDGYTDAVRTLHARVQDLDALRVTPEGLERVREQADRARRYAGMLRWMVDGEYMMLPQDDVANLTAVEAVGDQVRDFRDADNLRRVLRPIRSLRVEQPRSFFCNPCVKDEPGFMQEFLTRLHSSRLEDAFGSQIQVVVQASGAGSQVLVFMPVR